VVRECEAKIRVNEGEKVMGGRGLVGGGSEKKKKV
jgi:hypothetical protein